MKKIIVLLGMIFVALIVVGVVSAALAQECSNSSYIFERSDIVINGTIEDVETSQISGQICTTTLTVNVEIYEKGSGGDEILIKLAGCDNVWVEDTPMFTEEDIDVKGQFFLINSTYENSPENEFVLTCGQWKKIETKTPDCKNLYWIDNDNKECGQKQFCGTYMYYGLQTFASKTQCLKAVNCSKEGENCGGFVGIVCCSGLICDKEPTSELGTCVKEDKTSCETDEDCVCAENMVVAAPPETKCKLMYKNEVGLGIEICPNESYCTKSEAKEIKCVENKCKIVNKFCDEEEDGKCYKTLSNGRKAEIKIMPETASEKAIERLGELGFNVTLKEVGKGNETKVVYELTGKKQGKFLGIFKIMARIKAQVDAETGEVKKVIKPWWSFLVSGI